MEADDPKPDGHNKGTEKWPSWSANWLPLILNVAITVATIAGVYVLLEQVEQTERALNESRKANALAADQFARSQRPWLSAELTVIDPLRFDAKTGNGSIGLEVMVKNSGQQVALNTRVSHYMTADLMDSPERLREHQKAFCERFRTENNELGNVIFPGEIERMTTRVVLRKADIESASRRLEEIATTPELKVAWRGRIHPGLITCIDYRSTLQPQHHQTRYFFLVGRRMDDFSITGAILPIGELNATLWRIFLGQHAD